MKTATLKPLAQRKVLPVSYSNNPISINERLLERLTYGVPAPRRMLTPGLLLKKHDLIRAYLLRMGLTPAEREAAFYLLRLYVYYGKVYPKAPNFTPDYYCSKRSFWRAVAKLQEAGLLDRMNRFIHHLQVSNCYRLDKLVLCLIRCLAEQGTPFLDDFTREIIRQTASSFWQTLGLLRVRLRDRQPITLMA